MLWAAGAFAKDTTPESSQEAREIFQKVIAFRTSEGLGQVPAMAQYLAERFRAAGFPEQDIHILPVGETASLVVRYRGNGRGGKPILLLAHMDVVTAKPEEWQRDPFTLIEENGYFFGLGKSTTSRASPLSRTTFLRLKREGFVLTRDLIVAFSGDEETGMLTTTDLAMKQRALTDAEYALNSDDGGGQLDESTGKPQYLSFVRRGEEISATYELTIAQSRWPQLSAACGQRNLRARGRGEGAAGVSLPGEVQRLDARQLQGDRSGDCGSARRSDDALRRESQG